MSVLQLVKVGWKGRGTGVVSYFIRIAPLVSAPAGSTTRVSQQQSRPPLDSDSDTEPVNPNKDRLSTLTAFAIIARNYLCCALTAPLHSSESSPDEGKTVKLSPDPFVAEMEKLVLKGIWAAKAEEQEKQVQAEAEEESEYDRLLKVGYH